MSATKSFVAFLVGAAAGGITALLLAPGKGEETRARIRKESQDLYHKGHDRLEGTLHTVGERAKGYREVTRDKTHHLTDALRHQTGAIKGAVHEAKVAYQRELHPDQGPPPEGAPEIEPPNPV